MDHKKNFIRLIELFIFATIFPFFIYSQSTITWQEISFPGNGAIHTLVSGANNFIYAACEGSGIFRTSDSGSSWEPLNTGLTDLTIRAFAIGSNGTMVVGTATKKIFVSQNGGTSWTETNTLLSAVTCVAVSTTGIIYAGTKDRSLFESTDNGYSWVSTGIYEQFGGEPLLSVSFVSPLNNGKIICGFYSARGIVYSSAPEIDFKWTYHFYDESRALSFTRGTHNWSFISEIGHVARTDSEYPYWWWGSWNEGLPEDTMRAIACDTSGRVFVGTGGHGVYESVYNGEWWNSANSGMGNANIYSLLSAKDGLLYAGTNDGKIFRTLMPTATILPPVLSTASDTVVSPSQIVLKWNEVENATSYRIQVSSDSSFTSIPFFENTVDGVTSITVSNFDSVHSYFWRVRSENGASVSFYSLVRKFITGPPPAPPQLITPQDDSLDVQPGSILFTWHPVTNAVEYTIAVSTDSSFSSWGSTVTSDTSASLYIYYNNIKYYWRVKAANIAGYGLFSEYRKFLTVDEPPYSPQLSSPKNGAIDQPINLTFLWNRRPNALRYVFIITNGYSISSGTVYVDSAVVDTFTTVTNLEFNRRYYWRVAGVNHGGIGGMSDAFSFNTQIAPPSPPVLLSPQNGTIGQPLLTTLIWRYNYEEKIDSSYVQITTDTSDWIRYGGGITVQGNAVSGYFDPSQKYYWRVILFNTTGAGEWSEIFTFTTGGAKNITRIGFDIPIKHGLDQNFPNPFNAGTRINFALPDFQLVEIKVYSILGEEISTVLSQELSPGTYQVFWQPQNLPSGTYFYRIQTKPLELFSNSGRFQMTKKMLYVK